MIMRGLALAFMTGMMTLLGTVPVSAAISLAPIDFSDRTLANGLRVILV